MHYCIDGNHIKSDYFHIVERLDEAGYVTDLWIFPTYSLARAFMAKYIKENPSTDAMGYDYFILLHQKVKIGDHTKSRHCKIK